MSLLFKKALHVDIVLWVGDPCCPAKKEALLDQELVEMLVAIDQMHSILKAAQRINCSIRHIQRTIRKFQEASGLILLEHHGPNGTLLTTEGKQCVGLFFSALEHTKQAVADPVSNKKCSA